VTDPAQLRPVSELLAPLGVGEATIDEHRRSMLMPVSGGVRVLRDALRRLEDGGIDVDDAGLRRPTLDDVFLTLTGHGAEDAPAEPDSRAAEKVSR